MPSARPGPWRVQSPALTVLLDPEEELTAEVRHLEEKPVLLSAKNCCGVFAGLGAVPWEAAPVPVLLPRGWIVAGGRSPEGPAGGAL